MGLHKAAKQASEPVAPVVPPKEKKERKGAGGFFSNVTPVAALGGGPRNTFLQGLG